MSLGQPQEHVLHYALSETSSSGYFNITDYYSYSLNRITTMLTSMKNTIMNEKYECSTMLRTLPQCSIINIHAKS